MKSLLLGIFSLVITLTFLLVTNIEEKESKTSVQKTEEDTVLKAFPSWTTGATVTEEELYPTQLTADMAKVSRIIIPKINVNAALETKGLDENKKMEDPSTATKVAWYKFDFDSEGNKVFAGHLNKNGKPAIFANLKELKKDDVIFLRIRGVYFAYSVVDNIPYEVNYPFFDNLVRSSKLDLITLITCDGEFVNDEIDYSHRRVVRATRIN